MMVHLSLPIAPMSPQMYNAGSTMMNEKKDPGTADAWDACGAPLYYLKILPRTFVVLYLLHLLPGNDAVVT